MPNWKKVIISGSDAALNSLNVTTSVTASVYSGSYIDLDVLSNGDIPSHKEGRIYYNTDEGALTVYNNEADVSLQVGQEFWIKCQNASATEIPNGTPVKITGASGDNVLVSPAIAENHVTGSHYENHIIGLATHDIPGNGQGYVTTAGTVRNVDTSDFLAGDSIYLQTGSAGLRNTPPPFPYDVVVVGYVQRVQQNNGEIFVMPKQPSHLSTLSGVSGSNGAVGDLWVYQDNDAWSPSKTLSGSYTIDNGDLNVDGNITGSDVQIDDWGSISASLAAATLTNPITGTGTTNYVSKFTGTNTLGDSLIFDNGTNVGIGTTSPDAKLHVYGDMIIGGDGSDAILRFWETTNGWNIRHKASDNSLRFSNVLGGTDHVAFGENGNVGIGETSPGYKLDVHNGNVGAGIARFSGADSDDMIFVTEDGYMAIDTRNTVTGLSFQMQGADKVRILPSGNVGIGTTSPSEELEVNGNIKLSETAATTDTDKFVVLDSGVLKYRTGTQLLSDIGAGTGTVTGTGTTNYISKWTSTTAQGNSQIFDNGTNVGIGTASPNHELVVQGTSNPNIELKNTNYSNGGFVLNRSNYTEQWKWWAESATMYFSFATDEVTYSPLMTLKSSGNVGIGTSSPGYKLDVNGSLHASALTLADAIYHEGDTNNYIGFLSDTQAFTTNGQERLRINSAGNVGIGTTSPSNKLDVSGNMSTTAIRVGSAASGEGMIRHNPGSGNGIALVTGAFSSAGIGLFVGHSSINRNVGIGTTSPSQKLDVNGNIKLSETAATTDTDKFAVLDSGVIKYRTGAQVLSDIGGQASITNPVTGTGTTNYISKWTGTNTQGNSLIFDNGTNVGIGTTSPDEKLHVDGNILVDSAILSNQENTDVDTGTETVAEISSTTYTAAFFDYVIKNGTNLRAGTVFACHDGSSNVEYTETSTNDLGDTSDVALKVDISGGNIRLTATTTSDNWSVKSLVRGL